MVVPTCDRPGTLRVVLDRLAPGAQQLGPDRYEVIVSDDGRRDRAAAMLAASHPWVRVVEGPRRGPAANRNAGAGAARGAFIAFTDDDTEPSRRWLSAFDAALAPGLDVLEGRTTCDGGFSSPLYHAPVNETGGRLWSCNFLISARAFGAVAGFDEGFRFPHMEDQDLRLRLIAARFRMAFVPDAVVNHPPRRQPDGARLGAWREAEVRFMYKHGDTHAVRTTLLENIFRYRLGVIRNTPKSFDTIRALGSLALEAGVVMRRLSEWKVRYAAEFPAVPRKDT